jgi:hypothetical protein
MICQTRVRDPGKREFTKHMPRLRHSGQITGEEANEIVLLNSHDGTSSYQTLAGTFRFVCQNGIRCTRRLRPASRAEGRRVNMPCLGLAFRRWQTHGLTEPSQAHRITNCLCNKLISHFSPRLIHVSDTRKR